MSQTTMSRPVGVEELRRAWRAVQAGDFRARQSAPRPTNGRVSSGGGWAPTGPVLPVLGCVSQAGASTLALAIATCASPARVLECAPASASGLAAAATAELGTTRHGWALGRREQVWIARTTGVLAGVGDVPSPDDPPAGVGLSVLDVAWETGLVMVSGSWVREQLLAAATVVAVTAPTVPGLRRLETTLTLLSAARVLVAVVGPPQRRWPSALSAALGPRSTAAAAEGRLVTVPLDRQLALRGVDTAPLPSALLNAAQSLLRLTVEPCT